MLSPFNKSLSLFSHDIYTTSSYDKEYVTCSCNLCKTINYNNIKRRRRRLQTSSIAGDTDNMEVVAMVEYVIIDTGSVFTEAELIWDGKTYNRTIPIIVTFSVIWLFFAIIVSILQVLNGSF